MHGGWGWVNCESDSLPPYMHGWGGNLQFQQNSASASTTLSFFSEANCPYPCLLLGRRGRCCVLEELDEAYGSRAAVYAAAVTAKLTRSANKTQFGKLKPNQLERLLRDKLSAMPLDYEGVYM